MPDLPKLFSDLVRTEIRLYNVLDRRLQADHGVGASQFAILRFIDQPKRCRVGDIARELVITVGAASKLVDRLESAGWVMRAPNPEDRRSSLLELTETGSRLLAAGNVTAHAELHRLLHTSLPESDLDQFAATMSRVLAMLDSKGSGQPED